ncbi:MAG TPA: hypothetical protein VMV09_09610 [Candidatus Saccharimonadales bacterium]|nr:hypothetical protein [Candidatus Saccharimonadales bacterium]
MAELLYSTPNVCSHRPPANLRDAASVDLALCRLARMDLEAHPLWIARSDRIGCIAARACSGDARGRSPWQAPSSSRTADVLTKAKRELLGVRRRLHQDVYLSVAAMPLA